MTPLLIFPTPVSARNFNIASEKIGLPNSLLTEQLPGPTLPPDVPNRKPFLPL